MEENYSPNKFESKIYEEWLKKKNFSSNPSLKKNPYVIVMPPPNITGKLHMGHVLNNTIQDILVRKARMEGKEACWVPGIDHASIATEAKVVSLLAKENIKKEDLSREEFLKEVWKWKNKYGDIILKQLKTLGVSCDWDRVTFTLDEKMYESVQKIFIQLYEEGLIYRGAKMINWDPQSKTSISDDEVIFKPSKSDLVFIKYKIVDSKKEILIATTRPETIFGDVALCCNPKDDRYKNLKGKKAIVPIINREIPIIFDEYVDQNFGTGCLKITPAHDMNDYKIGKKFSLPEINIFDDDATLNHNAGIYQGRDRFVARKNIMEDLSKQNLISKTEKIENNIGYSERTDSVIEPKISTQWFLKMNSIVKPAIDAVKNGEINFFPKKFENIYNIWLNNIHEWCISRQLWWGHRIPAYYLENGEYFVAKSLEEALEKAKLKTGNKTLTIKDLKQDDDVLDTWFSAWIWPVEVFKGISNEKNEDFKYFYPTNDLVTAPEIIFFWVARMIIAGYHFTGKAPFKNVYFTGIVKDKQKKKMSKSLGNSPEPIDLIDKYGADGVRIGLMISAKAGNDLIFNEKLCEQGKNFANKIWNAAKFIKKLKISQSLSSQNEKANIWIENKFNKTRLIVEEEFKNYKISQALIVIYKFVWDDFCSLYIEMIKSSENIDKSSHEFIKKIFSDILKLIHPFMPFISEKLWIDMEFNETYKSICVAPYPKIMNFNSEIIEFGNNFSEFLTRVRNIKSENKISQNTEINLFIEKKSSPWIEYFSEYIKNMLKISFIEERESDMIEALIGETKIYISTKNFLKIEKNTDSIKNEIARLEKFLSQIDLKLKNKKFLENAKKEIIEVEKKKYNDTMLKIESLKKNL